MLVNYVRLSCLLTCVLTNEAYSQDIQQGFDYVFPSIHHVVGSKFEKREADLTPLKSGDTTPLVVVNQTDPKSTELTAKVPEQISEGNLENKPSSSAKGDSTNRTKTPDTVSNNSSIKIVPSVQVPGNTSLKDNNNTATLIPPVKSKNVSDSQAPKPPSYQPDLSNPGVMKRGLIVFGAFALMAVAYFIFYRRKSKNNDSNNTHGSSDTNQFRYGVLHSEDRRDNLELSRIPLTMESDEDEDEDLEIFDLEQKKKSLSYVNLHTSDDYIVHGDRENERDRENLLLDIEDPTTDTLINWSSNGNKSIL